MGKPEDLNLEIILYGSDLSTLPDIAATFNSDIDNNNNCLNNTNWYYGIDGNKPSNSFGLLTVVLHEIGHGLGFQTFVDISTGAKLGRPGRNDAYMLHLEDHSLNQTWDQLSDSERVTSATDTADLHWSGSEVTTKVGDYTAGINQGHVRQYAPAAINSGSSVSSRLKAESSPAKCSRNQTCFWPMHRGLE